MIETECQRCGSSVTPQFVRVFDEAEGVHACPAWTGEAAIISGVCRPGGRRSAGGVEPVTTPSSPSPEAPSDSDVATDGGEHR